MPRTRRLGVPARLLKQSPPLQLSARHGAAPPERGQGSPRRCPRFRHRAGWSIRSTGLGRTEWRRRGAGRGNVDRGTAAAPWSATRSRSVLRSKPSFSRGGARHWRPKSVSRSTARQFDARDRRAL